MNLNCRLCCCRTEHYLDALYDLKDPDLMIEFKLEKVFKLKLQENDEKLMSQIVCLHCVNSLNSAESFYEKVVETQELMDTQLELIEDTVLTEDLKTGEIKLEMLLESESPTILEESIVEHEHAASSEVEVLTKIEPISLGRKTDMKKKNREGVFNRKRTREGRLSNENTLLRMEDIFCNEYDGIYSTMPDSLELERHQKCADGSLTKDAAESVHESSWNVYEWKCIHCSNNREKLIFDSRFELEDHFKLMHRDIKVSYPCADCTSLSFKSYFSFQNHTIEHRPILKFCCDICSKIYWNIMDLHNHRMNCNPKMRHTCLYCGKMFESGFFLKQHAGHHQKFKPEELYHCDMCSYSAHTKFLIKQHLTLTHVGKEKELVCGICGKICKRTSDMVRTFNFSIIRNYIFN